MHDRGLPRGGDPDLGIEKYPPYAQAAAALDQAKRDLDHTVLRAPIAGMATQVASIQMGRYVTAGTPVAVKVTVPSKLPRGRMKTFARALRP